MSRISLTAHRLRFYDWSGGELRPTDLESLPFTNWQARKCRRSIQIIVQAQLEADRGRPYPKAFTLRRYGRLVTEGWIDWEDPSNPFVRYEPIPIAT